MRRELILLPKQTVSYYVMYGLESGYRQSCHIAIFLEKNGIKLSKNQISGALQRLKKQGLVEYDCGWFLKAHPFGVVSLSANQLSGK